MTSTRRFRKLGCRRSMTTQRSYSDVVGELDQAFRRLERQVPPPQAVEMQGKGLAFRYIERLPHQAIIVKLSRIISDLKAVYLLLGQGFPQQVGVLKRILDDLHEDVHFIVLTMQEDTTEDDKYAKLKDEFFRGFWEEEFDGETALESSQKRPSPKRSSIRAYCHRVGGLPDPSTGDKLGTTIHKTFSGYVHGAAPHLMEMVREGAPPLFETGAVRGSWIWRDHVVDTSNYLLRSVYAFGMAAKAFGDEELWQNMREIFLQIENLIEQSSA